MRVLIPILALCAVSACKKEDMYTQRVIRQWDQDALLANAGSERPPVADTLAQELPDEPASQPATIDAALLSRGQARYRIFCTPCHAESGDGNGMIVQRGFPHPPSFTSQRLVHARAQVIYDAITNGHGAMYSYAARVPPPDRWAIAAYVRALQLSQAATIADLPEQDRAHLARGVGP